MNTRTLASTATAIPHTIAVRHVASPNYLTLESWNHTLRMARSKPSCGNVLRKNVNEQWSSPMEQLRIDYDDDGMDIMDIMDKVNSFLAPHHLIFIDDGQDHDGYCLFALETKEQP